MLTIRKTFATYLLKIPYVRNACEHPADIGELRRKPEAKVYIGLGFIVVSYVIGWPLVLLLGTLSAVSTDPLLIAVGGPVAYGISHLIFLAGAYLAGAKYAGLFFRWGTRMAVEKMLNSPFKNINE